MPDEILLYKEVDEGRLGQVYYAEATTLRRRGGVPTWGVFLNRAKQGGGPLIDTGTHIVDSTLWLMNDYSPVRSAVGCLSAYDREMAAWVDAVWNDTPPCVLPEQAAQVVKLLEALYISARSGGQPYCPAHHQ